MKETSATSQGIPGGYSLILLLTGAFTYCWPGISSAVPDVDALQILHFGTLAVPQNNSVSSLTLPYAGNNISINGSIAVIQSPIAGTYHATGFPANVRLTISVANANITLGGGGGPEPLRIRNYTSDNPLTNGAGEAQFSIGAELSTTGNTVNYSDGGYSGDATLSIEYWSPDLEGYVTDFFIIDIEATLQTALTLTEQQSLSFGTLFARATPDDQASMTIQTNGNIATESPGETRMVSIVAARPAILDITGAAPSTTITITPQAGSILLTHDQLGGAAPRFVIDDFVTLPNGSGFTDQNGFLQIRVGATLSTELTPSTTVYPSGTYRGTYDVTVSY